MFKVNTKDSRTKPMASVNFQCSEFPKQRPPHVSKKAQRELELLSQLTFTGSKSTIETLEKGVKYVQS